LSAEVALSRYLAQARRAKAADTAAVRWGLIARASAMSPAVRRSGGAVPVAAALFAVSLPKALRSGAFSGCLSELRKETSR
jgi:hypothetical protein